MSIIQEALKKAQGDFAGKKSVSAPAKSAPAAQPKEVPLPSKAAPDDLTAGRHYRKMPSLRLPALVSVLVILLLVYGLKASLQYSRKHDGTPVPVKQSEEQSPAQKKTIDGSDLNVFGSQTHKLDPINFMGPRQSLLVLNGIMYVENRPQAIINGQVLEEGDKVSGATVLAIERDCVLLDLNDTNIRLEINKKS